MPFHHLLIPTLGQLAGQALPLILAPRPRSVSPQAAFDVNGGTIQQARLALPALGAAAAPVARMAGRAVGAILARVSATVGRRISGKQVMALVRRVGPEAAAVALGISVAELMQVVSAEVMRPRRRRGISARDISRCRSTIRRMRGFQRMLGGFGGGGRRRLPSHGHRIISVRK